MSQVSMPVNGRVNTGEEAAPRRSRAYQLEMLEESLRRNVIVVMDTGSGKTEIAILRIQKELGQCPPEKLVWFIAPTIPLAEQQHSVISKQLPAFQTRILTSLDKVDHWSTKKIWDDILFNIRIVTSTPQVMLDALSNGFVNLHRIALLVFDEAHHCLRKAAANKIMQNFYHYHRQQAGNTDGLPHVLGLTASPVIKGRHAELRELESNLNAVCVTPKMHREELIQFVHMPQFYNIEYHIDVCPLPSKAAEISLILDSLDIEDDPFVKVMRQRNDAKSQQKLLDALLENETPCRNKLRRCYNSCAVLYQELGPWAEDTFIARCKKQLQDKHSDDIGNLSTDWDREDDFYILEVLSKISPSPGGHALDIEPVEISTKVHRLIKFLEKEHIDGSAGIVFAKERATAVMLTHLLTMHPRLKHIKAAAFLGTSAFASRKSDITELQNSVEQNNVIDDLRTGKKNLIVGTAVLEEGIDIPACDLVVCFDLPKNLKSFIQRRGRARKRGSKFAVFLDKGDETMISKLKLMEAVVKENYLENERTLEEIRCLEDIEEHGYDNFRIKSTGALLSLENARNHLSHFCGTLACEFTDSEPEFIIEGDSEVGLSAKVILPNFLDRKFRRFQGISIWRTEKMAKQDAAFQAYMALYEAGLVNDHLMPAHHRAGGGNDVEPVEKRPSFANTSEAFNPWAIVASRWQEAKEYFQNFVEITADSQAPMLLVLPVELPCDISFQLFWNEATTLLVSVKRSTQKFAANLVRLAADTTSIILSALFSEKMISGSLDFSWLFLPKMRLSEPSIREWCESVKGRVFLSDIEEYDPADFKNLGLVRRVDNRSRPWTFGNYIWRKCLPEPATDDACVHDRDSEDREVLYVEGTVWPKRTDFLHPVANLDTSKVHHTAKCFHPASQCVVDKLPVQYTRFALFIPCLIHNIEIHLIADELARTVLRSVNFSNLSLVLTAISSSAAREASNYQRLEFLGDSLLKLYTSVELAAKKPLWPEGLLASTKGRIVSNGHLANAALRTGLDMFILTKPFTGRKWRPSYNSDHTGTENGVELPREMSTKVLADVVEALIGAASIDGGHEKALRCLKVFLPDIEWSPFNECVNLLYDAADINNECNMVLPEIKGLLGYTFTKKSLLLAAVTHPSSRISSHSYQRLEFVGDSILDTIIVEALFESPREFPHYDLHLMRTALVNADFLAFLCMNTYIEEDRGEAIENSKKRVKIAMTKRKIYLWEFMNHSVSWDISDAQRRAMKQYEELEKEINERLNSSKTYPWTLLCRLNAAKFFSDIIESILGAIFIDSRGSMSACQGFLQRIGLMRYLEFVLTEDIDFMHPKERLGLLANTLSVQYETRRTGEREERRWECSVEVGDEQIIHVGDGVSSIEAETRAAEAAVAVLRARSCNSEQRGSDDVMSE